MESPKHLGEELRKTWQVIFGWRSCHRLCLMSAETALAGAVVHSCPPRKAARDGDTSLVGVDGKNYVMGQVWVRDDRPLCAKKRIGRIQL